MYANADDLKETVIQPTLEYLGAWTPESELFLLSTALEAPELGLFSARNAGLGIFNITAAQHREIWDNYLAFNPDLASRIRGLASQRAFLRNPDAELQTNLSYCTAIAWLLYVRASPQVTAEPARQETCHSA